MAKLLTLVFVALCMFGCGGNGSFGGGPPTLLTATKVTSLVDLGSPIIDDLSTLMVETSAKLSPVSAAGKADVLIFNNGPQFAAVKDSTGRIVLMAMLTSAAPNINAESTARAIAYFALGGPWKKAEGRLTILNELHTINGFTELVAQVQGQLDAVGHVNQEAGPIQQAIETFVNNALQGTDGVIVDPTTASGLSVDSTVEGVLTVQNVFLRRVGLHIRRTGYKDEAGVHEEPNTPWMKQEMPLVARYGGITGTLDGLIKGEVPYSPVTSTPPFNIPRYPNEAIETYYKMVAIGPGVTDGPGFNELTQEQLDDLSTMEYKSLFLDVFMVLLANAALPLAGDEVDDYLRFIGGNAALTDILNNLRTTVPQAAELMGEGKYYEAAKAVFTSSYTSNTLLPLLAQLTLDFIDQNSNLSDMTYDRIYGSFSSVLDAMGKADIVITLADTALLYADFLNSNRSEKFNITVIASNVTLQAERTTIRPTSTTRIKAIIQDRDPNASYLFKWSVEPHANYWVEDRFLNGTDDFPDHILPTGEDEVNIRSLVTTNGVGVVKCKVFHANVEVGEGEIAITFDEAAPTSITNLYNDYQAKTVVSQLSNGQWQGGGATYIDLPRDVDALDYNINMPRHDSLGSYYIVIREPLTVVEYFPASVGVIFWGQVPARKIRLWVRSWGGSIYNTQAEAKADIEGRIAGWIADARTRPVTLKTIYWF